MATDRELEHSEFSINELLYMGDETMTFVIENMIAGSFLDPFEIIARIEEAIGGPLANHKGGQEPM